MIDVTAALSSFIEVMNKLAPPFMALDGDNIGLQTPCAPTIDKVLFTLDVNIKVVREAKRRGAGLIAAHHPVIYRKLDRIEARGVVGRVIVSAIRDEIGIFVAHTNLDCAPGGVNDILAHRLELQNVRALKSSRTEKSYKVVVFVPEAHVDKVRAAMAEAGGGVIGEYRYCSFQTPGTGTFLPSEKASPFAGKVGQVNKEPELRLEMLVPQAVLGDAVAAMKIAHPYEEVAYDVYELANPAREFGLGRVGELPERVHFKDYVELVRRRLGVKRVRVCGNAQARIRTVAACGGSGGDLLEDVLAVKADAYITGELKYHQMLAADAQGLCVVEAGHGATERIALPVLADNVKRHLPGIETLMSRIKTDRSDWV